MSAAPFLEPAPMVSEPALQRDPVISVRTSALVTAQVSLNPTCGAPPDVDGEQPGACALIEAAPEAAIRIRAIRARDSPPCLDRTTRFRGHRARSAVLSRGG